MSHSIVQTITAYQVASILDVSFSKHYTLISTQPLLINLLTKSYSCPLSYYEPPMGTHMCFYAYIIINIQD